ncbi:MAG: HAD family hydrolase [Candidatus Aenigmatarchaeota archaeon]
MKQKIIFWDWTGTLADESKLDENVCKSMEMEIARKNNISFEEAENKYKSYLKKLENTWKWHDYKLHGKTLDVDWKFHQMSNLKKLVLLPYAKEILEYTKQRGYVNVLATNAVRSVILLRLDYAGMSKLFDAVIACDDVQAMKSEGKHFERGLMLLNGDAASSFSIGDNPVQDILSAKKIGIRTIFCAFNSNMTHYHSKHISANHEENVEADFTIKDLLGIKSII